MNTFNILFLLVKNMDAFSGTVLIMELSNIDSHFMHDLTGLGGKQEPGMTMVRTQNASCSH